MAEELVVKLTGDAKELEKELKSTKKSITDWLKEVAKAGIKLGIDKEALKESAKDANDKLKDYPLFKTTKRISVAINQKNLDTSVNEAQRKLDRLKDVNLKVNLDIKNATSGIMALYKMLTEISKPVKIDINADVRSITTKLQNIQGRLDTLKMKLDISHATSGIMAVHKMLVELSKPVNISIDTNNRSIIAKLQNIQGRLGNIEKQKSVDVDTSKFNYKLTQLATYINQFNSKDIEPKVDKAISNVVTLSTYMNQLKSKDMKLTIDADIQKAKTGITAIYMMIKELSDKKYKLGLDVGELTKKNPQLQTTANTLKNIADALNRIKTKTVNFNFNTGGKNGNLATAVRTIRNLNKALNDIKNNIIVNIKVNDNDSLPKLREIAKLLLQIKRNSRIIINTRNSGGFGGGTGGSGGGSGSGSGGYNPFETWWQRLAYGTRLGGRASKGIGSALEGLAQAMTDMGRVYGTTSPRTISLGIIVAAIGSLATFGKALDLAVRGVQTFGNILINIGESIYNVLKPGIELYKQQQSALFSMSASIMANGVVNGQRLSQMPEGSTIARGLSNEIIQRATIDAEMSAFSLEEILRSLQGTLPILMNLGMSLDEAYRVNKGVAGVAKMIQLTPSQILQETRDLAQGSITSRGSQVANALGVTNADLQQFQGDSEALFNFLMERFESYSELLNEFEDTALGRWQQLEERWQSVTKNLVDGIAPMFKGLFEGLIELTGQYVDKNGNYLDVLTGEWHNASGEVIATQKDIQENGYEAFGIEEPHLELSEELEKAKEVLQDLILYWGQALDTLWEYIKAEFGISDPLEFAKILVIGITKAFMFCVELAVDLVKWVKNLENLIVVVINTVRGVALAFASVLDIVTNVTDMLSIAKSYAAALASYLVGDVKGANEAISRAEELKTAVEDRTKNIVQRMNVERFTSYDDIINSVGGENKVDGYIYNLLTKYIGKDVSGDKGDTKNVTSNKVRGIPKEDTKALNKALKEAIKQSQKELKARLAELRASLEDTLDRLKEILEENEMKYKQGFMTIDEYYSEKARIELEEAQAKLEEAQAERKLIETAMYSSEEDREKALAENDKKINKYTKETAKMEKGVREVSRVLRDTTKMLGDFINTMKKGTLVNGKVVNSKQGYATVTPTSSLVEYGSNQGITKDIVDEVVKQSAQYGANADNYAKMAIAMMIRESGGNKDAISPVGAIGLMQLMPDTAEGLGVDPYNWVENIAGGLKYIDQLAQEFGWDIDKIIAGYNAGPQAVKEYGGVPPYAETQEHVRIVSGYYNELDQLSTQAVSIASETAGSIYDAIDIALNRDGYLGQTLENGRVACVEAGTKLGSYYSDAFKEAVNRGIVNTDVLDAFFDEIGVPDVSWSEELKDSLNPGDIIYLDTLDEFGDIAESNSHVMLYKGNGMVVGNYSSKNGGLGGVGEQDLDSYLKSAREYSWQIPSHVRRTGTYGLASGFSGGFSSGDSIGQSINTTAYLDKNALAEMEEVKDFISKTLALKSEVMEGTFGYPMQKLQQFQIEYEDEVKKITGKWVNSKNPVYAQAGLERLDVLKKKHDLEVAKLTRNSVENQFEYQINQLKKNAEVTSADIFTQRTNVGESISQLVNNINKEYGLGKLVDELEKARQSLLATGRFIEASEIQDKINSLRETIIDVIDGWIDQSQKYWDNAEAIFNATSRFTPTQREFAEREFNAYRAQKKYEGYTQKGNALSADYKKNLKELKELTKYSGDYAKNQKRINELITDNKKLEALMAENEQMKKLANLSSKMPDYLDDIGKAARDALDNGLVEFLTDGITEAESLSEALRDLATGILKEIQKVSAKWMVKGLMNGLFGQFDVDKEMPLDYTGQLDIINNSIIDGANRIVGAIGGQVGQSNYQGTSLLAGVQTGQPRSFELNSWQKSPFYSGQAYAGLGAFSSSWGQSPLNPNAQTQTQTQTVSQNFSELSGSLADVNTQFQTTSTMSLPSFTDSISDVTNDIQADTSISNSTQQLASQIDMGSSQFQSAFSQVTSILETVATTLQTIASSLQSVSTQISSLSFGTPTGASTGALVKNNRILKFAKGGAVFRNSGLINGPGSETSDSIPAMLSNGEAVLNAKAVKELGVNFISAVNNGEFSRIRAKIPHFSSGGTVNNTQQMTARGMSDFARNISTNVSTNNQMNIALVRDESESLEHFMRSPRGQNILVDFQKGNGRVFSRFSDRF